MSSFVKPKVDTTLYLWSKDAQKVLKEDPITKYPKTFETADSPDITVSSVNQGDRNPFRIFDGLLTTSAWFSIINRGDYVGGVYQGNNFITDAYGEKYYGESIRIDLKELIILREYKIYPFDLTTALIRAPGSFRVYGSTDNITHYLIDEEINQRYTTQGKTFVYHQIIQDTGIIH